MNVFLKFPASHICDLFYHYELNSGLLSNAQIEQMTVHMSHICDLFEHYIFKIWLVLIFAIVEQVKNTSTKLLRFNFSLDYNF